VLIFVFGKPTKLWSEFLEVCVCFSHCEILHAFHLLLAALRSFSILLLLSPFCLLSVDLLNSSSDFLFFLFFLIALSAFLSFLSFPFLFDWIELSVVSQLSPLMSPLSLSLTTHTDSDRLIDVCETGTI